MARAHTIWVVRDFRTSHDGPPEAVFTVKHECITWLERQPDLTGWEVQSWFDAGRGARDRGVSAMRFIGLI